MDNSTYDVGSAATTPREIRELRRHNLEYHHRLGNPVVFKRRKTLKDIETGKAVRCPYNYDSAYHSDISTCPYCFGTGILGGFDSGIIVFVTIGDAITDQFQLTQQGLLTRMTHPQWTAPWKPEMHDGDLIVLAQFDPDTLAITETDDRFEIDQVTPVTPRGGAPIGFAKNRNRNSFNFIPRHDMLVAQSFRADMLPEGHPWYNVPDCRARSFELSTSSKRTSWPRSRRLQPGTTGNWRAFSRHANPRWYSGHRLQCRHRCRGAVP
jgi:hypothetical protein